MHSRNLETVSSAKTRIERDLDPDSVRRLTEISKADITIGGAEFAGHALALGPVDECHLVLGPSVVGGGKRALPDEFRAQLELLDERRFAHGVILSSIPRKRLTARPQTREPAPALALRRASD